MGYRIYILNDAERAEEIILPFADDDAALHYAATLRAGLAAEVWHGERLVGRLGEAFILGPRGSGLGF